MSELDGYSLRGEALRQAIAVDVASGLVPFFVGALDDLVFHLDFR